MKMSEQTYNKLRDAINQYRKEYPEVKVPYVKNHDEAQRWHYYFVAKFDLEQDNSHPVFTQYGRPRIVAHDPNFRDQFEAENLNDEHIDTALRKIMSEPAEVS